MYHHAQRTDEAHREARLRRRAARRGWRIEKSRGRNPQAAGFGGYMLVDTATNTVVAGGHPFAYSLNLDAVQESLL